MGMAFGISEDDVLAVALNAGQPMTEAKASEAFDQIDGDEVEEAALYFDDMDEQTGAAHEEIRRQLIGLGYLKE
jgi:hypothetical protein